MTKIDIFSGFLGAGKTTLIKKLIQEAYQGEKLVLIENEFGEIGIDGGFLQDAGVEITEMNSGCICCSLVGDFGQALEQVLFQFKPDRILIEPSGVGKLSDVIGAVQRVDSHDIQLNAFVTVADASKCKIYMKNFGEFFNNQIEHAAAIVLSRTAGMTEKKLLDTVKLLREHNANAPIITTPWEELDGKQILETMENKDTLKEELARLAAEQAAHDEEHGHHHDHDHDHHHHHHDHDHEDHDHEEHEHHHDHDHDHGEHEHHHDHDHDHDHDHEEHEHHHHHDHDHEEHEHHHHHHHDHDHEDSCSCGHDHDADEVFISWGAETPRKYTEAEITGALNALADEAAYGVVLRAKGIVPCDDGTWIHFDYVPGEENVRRGPAGITGRLCVIGSELNEDALDVLFHLN
ncbi:CobW family GTP-binding protein [Evtepia sp.]|uniref:GTP-binding protein n=1 Tax=Evtepia sp. TaxID=2773933 RepID=UPI002A804498|nr:CobW family GTP-binding protein [Evtepia sp.]MDY4430663.1 CobW family GTP-binding protein [Evtepia sp.]